MIGFDFQPRTRIVYGPGSVDRLGELVHEILDTQPAARSPQHVLLVTDPGIVAAGHVERACRSLSGAGVAVILYDQVRENPTTRDVDACLAVAQEAEANGAAPIDVIIGLGGGSSLDTAKGCILASLGVLRGACCVLRQGRRQRSRTPASHRPYTARSFSRAPRERSDPAPPLIAVPTTAGTGSECQSYALIADEETHRKMACGDPKAAPRVAILDPSLTLSLPRQVTACTGIDALAHAVESAVTRRRNELSALYSREAFRLIVRNLECVLDQPDDLEARAAMQLGAAYAGMAIELSMLGAAHAAANPLTARLGTVHGHAVGLMLPHVVRYNAQDPAARAVYRELMAYAGEAPAAGRRGGGGAPPRREADVRREASVTGGPGRRDEALADLLSALVARAFGNVRLEQEGNIPDLSREAAEQWTARFNPRPIAAEEFAEMYRGVLVRGASG